jgi:hypothetical protein
MRSKPTKENWPANLFIRAEPMQPLLPVMRTTSRSVIEPLPGAFRQSTNASHGTYGTQPVAGQLEKQRNIGRQIQDAPCHTQRHQYAEEIPDALEVWSRHIEALTSEKKAAA